MLRCVQIFVVLGLLVSSAAGLARGQTIKTINGLIAGEDRGDVAVYQGIPYAMPPLGELRWTPPQAAAAWEGTLEATRPAAQCPQNADLGVFAKAGGDENCLYLNIYVPKAPKTGKLPVLIWLHGGGFIVGAANDHDGTRLAVDGKAIVVTLGYRLGVLGFFAHPGIDGEGHPFANYGLMDQQLAFKWVRDNITSFGGDAENVTIFGESSGATSAFSHLVSPGAEGLFQHVIAMSGSSVIINPTNFGDWQPLELARQQGAAFAKAAGCAVADTACLRALPVHRILELQSPFITTEAIIDGTVIPKPYGEALKNGEFHRVTLINGATKDEWRWSAGFVENLTGEALDDMGYRAAMQSFYGTEMAEKVMQEYPLENYPTPTEAYSAAASDSLFVCTARQVNKWIAQYMPVYAYEFADRTAPSYLSPTSFPLGAAHTFELPYIFQGYHGGAGQPVELNPMQDNLSAKMITYWSTPFLASEREEEWPRYDPAKDNFMTFILPEPRMIERRFTKEHHCDFWDQSGIY